MVESDINTNLRNEAIKGDLEKVKELMQKGADVNHKNQHQNTALHLATLYGHRDVVDHLVKNGKADLNIPNQNGQTALQLACIKGFIEIVKVFTELKCELDLATEYSGMTALHFASKEGHAEICQHLLDSGATEEIDDFVDKIPEFYAANESTEEVFRKRKPKSTPPSHPEPPPTEPSPPPPKPASPPPEPNTKTPSPPPRTPSPPPPPKAETPPPPPPKAQTPPPHKPESPPPKAEPPKAQEPAVAAAKPKEPKEAERRKRDDWTPKRNNVKIKSGLDYNFKHNKMEFDYKKKEGNFQKLKNHDFEWSEDFKARQGKSVFDRLLGGKKKTDDADKKPGVDAVNKVKKKANAAASFR